MYLLILGLTWLIPGGVLYHNARKTNDDTRFDRSTRAEAAGLALLWPLVICIMVLYGIAHRAVRFLNNTFH